MKRVLIPLLFFVLVGCATTSPTVNYIKALALACDSYASTLVVLAARRAAGSLTAPEIRTVSSVRLIVEPICTSGDTVVDPRAALNRMSLEANKLLSIKRSRGL